MKHSLLLLLSLVFCTLDHKFLFRPAIAQVIVDGTTDTTLTTIDSGIQIDDGNRAGGNLFHSFRQFSIFNGNEAFFNNASDVVNIFSRVTGGNISNIDGILRANGTANLFFINPAGIIFGENASINLGGSFYGSTADSIVFSDGEFNATDLANPPLITINAPIGLSFRDNPASIKVSGNGSRDSISNIEVNQMHSFNLIGGNINLNSETIFAPTVNIELISLSQSGIVNIDMDGNLNVPQSLQKADIYLDDFIITSFTSSNETAGDIKITGKFVYLLNESVLDSGTESIGKAGNIIISASKLALIQDGSLIISNTIGQGDGGNVSISAGENISFDNRSQISSTTFGRGNAGDLNLNASSINIDNSSIFSNVGSRDFNAANQEGLTGNGGLISIDTQTLSLSDGGTINSLTFGEGNGGQIKINASDSINISGVSSFPFLSDGVTEGGFSSGLFTSTELGATGSGGEIVLTTPRLQMNDGGIINARSRSDFAAGNVTINANVLELNSGSQILTTALSDGTAGNIDLNISEQILITGTDPSFSDRKESVIAAFGKEDAEFIIDPISAKSGIFANSPNISASSGGEISIITENLTLSDQGLISATSNSQVGGDINIDSRFIIAFPSRGDGSDIIAQGGDQGGNININAEQIFNLEEREAVPGNETNDIDASSEFGLDGNVSINTPDVNTIRNVTELSSEIVTPEQTIAQVCQGNTVGERSSGLTIKGKGGILPKPTEIFNSEILLEEDNLTAPETLGHYPEIRPIETNNGYIFPARGILKTVDGKIILTAYPTESVNNRIPNILFKCTKS